MCYRTGEYTVCRRVLASFSPEILQAGAVKLTLPVKLTLHFPSLQNVRAERCTDAPANIIFSGTLPHTIKLTRLKALVEPVTQ